MRFAERLDFRPSICITDHRTNRDHDNVKQLMALLPINSWIL